MACSFLALAGSRCQRIAPMANWDASTSNSYWWSWSGATSTRDEVTMLMSVSKAWQQLGVHSKVASFFRRFVRGLAKLAKFGMKGHWYPRTPRIFLTSLTFPRVWGQLCIPASFPGSIVILWWFRHMPRKLISSFLKRHLVGWRNRWFSLRTWRNSVMIWQCRSSSPSPVMIEQSCM